jgi:antitoxin VapB
MVLTTQDPEMQKAFAPEFTIHHNPIPSSPWKALVGLGLQRGIQSRYTPLGEIAMSIGTVFVTNRTQAVRLPLDMRLPEGVRKVEIRARGNERIIAPLGLSWDSFSLGGPNVSDDFLPERASQHQPEREAL